MGVTTKVVALEKGDHYETVVELLIYAMPLVIVGVILLALLVGSRKF